MNKYYTMIGSRSTPDDIQELLKQIATKLESKGYTVRSGGADGADSCCNHVTNKEIYIPWNGFNNYYKSQQGVIVYSDLGQEDECDDYYKVHHQWWNNIKKDSVKHLHRRNIHQVLGKDLDSPSKFVICYAEPDTKRGKGHVKGGTGTAVSLALSGGVRVYNLYYKNHVEYLTEKLL